MTSLASYRLFSTYSHTRMQYIFQPSVLWRYPPIKIDCFRSYQTVSMVFGFLQLYTLSFSLPCCGCQ
ncbi:hypothetical protein Y032_0067g128 [Ancylostoma ceylanicum]|uniref:Uncharacterized protein n=1 Tax=Ancylostoma ceylanicum TaxID=53326 RepID=A0A016TZX6_9BILA|nr:hypothetical protein Y032_0067g128 [Ancylostoma ceylanicum]